MRMKNKTGKHKTNRQKTSHKQSKQIRKNVN
jgi:hypothetical protein